MISVEKIFDKSSKNYDKVEEVRFKEYTEITLNLIEKYLNPEAVVLDFGCATGTKALTIAGKVKKIYAIDISSKMIEIANRKKIERGISNVDFIHASIFDNRFESCSFDAILSFNIFHLLEDGTSVIKRISDLLKPDGLLITTTPCLGEKMRLIEKLKFLPFIVMMKTGITDSLKRFKFKELDYLLSSDSFQIIEARKTYLKLSNYFIVAKKVN